MTRQMIQNVKQANVIELLCEVLELSVSSEKKVVKTVEEFGIQAFFTGIDALDVEDVEKDRIKALKEVIEAKAKSLDALEGVQ